MRTREYVQGLTLSRVRKSDDMDHPSVIEAVQFWQNMSHKSHEGYTWNQNTLRIQDLHKQLTGHKQSHSPLYTGKMKTNTHILLKQRDKSPRELLHKIFQDMLTENQICQLGIQVFHFNPGK